MRITRRFKKRRAKGFEVVWGCFSNIEEEELDVVAEAGDPVGSWKLLVKQQNDGIDERNRGWPIASVLRVGNDW